MLNYRPNGRRRLERPLNRLLDKAETRLSRPNSWRMTMIPTRLSEQWRRFVLAQNSTMYVFKKSDVYV
jgi:hypothetical protein